ncbi:MAG: translation initiation factor IF-3 [Clostridia bacterium]|nr:translation initiation factor IF-3 [Clostridia bacterium]
MKQNFRSHPVTETKRGSITLLPCGRILFVRKVCFRTFFYFIWGCFPIKNNNNSKELLINEKINFDGSKEVRIIGADNEQLGLVSFNRALDMADEAGLDLVLIAAQAEPPVCRIMDYGKYRYERDKREKDAKKKQQVVEIKEIQLSVRIDTNDFNTKVNRARGFLTRGDKVKVVVRFKGRQMTHQEIGQELLARFSAACEDVCIVDKQPKLEGRFLSMFLAPQTTKTTKQ